jgi:hypothetical protein
MSFFTEIKNNKSKNSFRSIEAGNTQSNFEQKAMQDEPQHLTLNCTTERY